MEKLLYKFQSLAHDLNKQYSLKSTRFLVVKLGYVIVIIHYLNVRKYRGLGRQDDINKQGNRETIKIFNYLREGGGDYYN